VSERAWHKIEQVKYCGYDALLPWKGALAKRSLPYTFDWHSLAALSRSLDAIVEEGLPQQIARHKSVAIYCRRRVREMALELYVKAEEAESDTDSENGELGYASTVTAIHVPLRERGGHFNSWEDFDRALRARGLVVGGSYGPLEGKVFRLGHMGSQANMPLVTKALDILEALLRDNGSQ
jgi:aspartate aminotransferase-like enzyme